MLDFFVSDFFYFCENKYCHAIEKRIFEKKHLQKYQHRDEVRETAETSSCHCTLGCERGEEGSEKAQDVMPEFNEYVEKTKVSVQVTRDFLDRWLVACGQEFKPSDKIRELMTEFIEQREEQKRQLKEIAKNP